MNWIYKQPVEIFFGSGNLNRLPSLIKEWRRPLLVSARSFLRNGLVQRIQNLIGPVPVFAEISPNPDVSEVNRCSRLVSEKEIDGIIAVGGGSVMDLAKAASLIVPDIRPFHNGEKVPESKIPIIAVPTTAGTGSEVTCVSVLTDRESGKKAPIVSESFYPKTALIDPELTVTLPPCLTASTGIDVLCHAVEGYWSKKHQPICDALAVHAIRLVFAYLPAAYEYGENLEAREKMAEASVIAGLAFTLPQTTSSHACSFPLTSIYHIPHGEACGLTLDYFVKVNAEDERTRQLVRILGYKDAAHFAEAVRVLKTRLGLRTDLKEFSLTEEKIRKLVSASHHPNLLNNPVRITDDILYEIYRSLSL